MPYFLLLASLFPYSSEFIPVATYSTKENCQAAATEFVAAIKNNPHEKRPVFAGGPYAFCFPVEKPMGN